MHRIRQQLVQMRTAQMNAVCGLLAEYGEAFGTGSKSFVAGIKAALERLDERLPMLLIDTFYYQLNELARLDKRVVRIEVMAPMRCEGIPISPAILMTSLGTALCIA